MKHINNIIIGGGISGYSFAQQCQKHNLEYAIFERSKVGGCICSESYEDLWFEQGGHTIYNSYSNTIEYIKDNSLEKSILKRKKLPFLFVNANGKMNSVFSNINLFSATLNFIKNRKLNKNGKSIKDYATKIFGKKNYDKTLKYCFDAVLSQDSKNFPMEYLFKKYPRNENLPRSFTLDGGLSQLFKNNKNIINDEVLNIYKQDAIWIVETSNENYSCDNICIATEWFSTAKLLQEITPSLAKHQYQPQVSNIISISIVVEKKQSKQIKEVAGLIGKEQFFYSMVSRDIINHPTLRAFTFHCKDSDTNINKICKLLKLDSRYIKYYSTKKNILPKYHLKHNQFIDDLDNEISKHQGLYISGNFFDRLAIENCIKRSYEEFNRSKQN